MVIRNKIKQIQNRFEFLWGEHLSESEEKIDFYNPYKADYNRYRKTNSLKKMLLPRFFFSERILARNNCYFSKSNAEYFERFNFPWKPRHTFTELY